MATADTFSKSVDKEETLVLSMFSEHIEFSATCYGHSNKLGIFEFHYYFLRKLC